MINPISTINIIPTSELFGATRLDAECYKPFLIEASSKLDDKETTKLSLVSTVADGDHSKFPENQRPERRYLRAQDIKNHKIIDDDAIYVSEEYFLKQKRSHITGENILLSIMGSVGDIVITPADFPPSIANRALCIVKEVRINPYFVYAYLLTDTSTKIAERLKTGGVQERLNLDVLRELDIPIAGKVLNTKIEEIIKSSQSMQFQTKSIFNKLILDLETEIGLTKKFRSNLYSIRNGSSYRTTNRYDSEYWQTIYDDIEEQIKSYINGYDNFEELIKVSTETQKIDASNTYRYVELANVNSTVGLIEEPSKLTGSELPSRARMKLKKHDVVLSSVEGSADKVALVKEDIENLVGSTGFFVLREKHFLPEVILALLRVPYINALFKRQAQGTILTAVPKSSLSRVILPKLPKQYQDDVAKSVQNAHQLHEKSKRLLEIAKQAVEIFIEKDEEKALAYIETNYEQV